MMTVYVVFWYEPHGIGSGVASVFASKSRADTVAAEEERHWHGDRVYLVQEWGLNTDME